MTDETVRPEDLKPGDEIEVTIRGRCAPPNFGDQKTVETIWFCPGTEKGFAVALRYLTHATITRLPPPVDPDLMLARKVVADMNRVNFPAYAREVERGEGDDGREVTIALAAIKAAKEQPK